MKRGKHNRSHQNITYEVVSYFQCTAVRDKANTFFRSCAIGNEIKLIFAWSDASCHIFNHFFSTIFNHFTASHSYND